MTLEVASIGISVKSDGIGEASKQLGGLGTSAKNAETKVRNLTSNIEKLMAVQKTATSVAVSYSEALVGAQQGVLNMNGSAAGLKSATDALVSSINSLTSGLASAQRNFQGINTTVPQSTRVIREHTNAMRDAHDMARGLSGGLGALWLTYGNIAPMVAGVAIAASMKAIVTVGKDVENTLEGIRVKGGETVENISKLRDVVMTLGQGVYGPQEVTKALETLILAGLSAKDAAQGINAALNLATVGGTTIEKASYALVQVGTALGYSAAGYDRIADVIAATAAASMSSVESISESFKSGSVVGKLYGATLSDIGVEFALLSNLGIKGSAAGTAVKNFYSVILGDNKKTVDALKSIGLSLKDLKDSEGNVKPLIEVFGTLDRALSKYSKSAQDVFVAHASNERGMKMLVEGLDAIRTKGEQTATKMEDIFKRIDESYGFAAQGAAAMALTVDAQFKSVKNTLETQFLKAFQDIQPQIAVVARALKDAFKSEEFTKGIQSIATAIADLTIFLIDNAGAVKLVLEAFIAWKAVSFVVGMLVSIATGLVAVEKALAASRIAALAFQASLGLLGAALLAAGAAYAWWLSKKEDATTSASSRATLAYLDDFNKKLDEENERLTKQIQLLAEGKTKREAETQAMVDQQRHMIELKRIEAGQAERTNYNTLKGNLSTTGQAMLAKAGDNEIKVGGLEIPTPEYKKQVEAVNEVIRAKRLLNSVETEAAQLQQKSIAALEKNIVLSKASSALADKNARESRAGNAGTEDIAKEIDKATARDKWRSVLVEIEGAVEQGMRQLRIAESTLDERHRQGLIGDISLIKTKQSLQVAVHQEAIKQLEVELEKAKTGPNSETRQQEIRNAVKKHEDAIVAAKQQSADQQGTIIEKLNEKNLTSDIARWKAQGEYLKAYEAESAALYDKEIARILADITSGSLSPEKYEAYVKRLNVISDTIKAGKDSAAFKDVDIQVQASIRSIEAGVAEINALTTDGSFVSKWFNTATLDQLYSEKLPALKKELEELNKKQIASGADADKKAYETRLRDYYKFIKQQRDVYKDFIDTVDKWGTEGFQAMFSKTEGSWKSYVKKMKESFRTQFIEEIYKMLARPLVLTVLANFANGIGATGLSAALSEAAGSGSGGSILGNLSSANSAYNVYNGTYLNTATSAWNNYAAGTNLGGYTLGYIGHTGSGISGSIGMAGSGTGITGSTGTSGLAYGSGVVGSGGTGVTGSVAGYGSATAGTAGTAGGTAAGASSSGLSAATVGWILAIIMGMKMSSDAWKAGVRANGDWSDSSNINSHAMRMWDNQYQLDKAMFGKEIAGSELVAILSGNSLSKVIHDKLLKWTGNDGGAPKVGGYAGDYAAMGLSDNFDAKKTGNPLGGMLQAGVEGIKAGYNAVLKEFGKQANLNVALYGHMSGRKDGDSPDNFSARFQVDGGDVIRAKGGGDQAYRLQLNKKLPEEIAGVVLQALEATKGLPAIVEQYLDSLAAAKGGLGKMKKDAVEAAFANVRVLDGVIDLMKQMGHSADAMSMSFANALGGIDKLASAMNTYFSLYYSQEEQLAFTQSKMAEQFKNLNLVMPTTKEGFRDLVEAVSKLGAAGSTTYAALIQLAPSFSQMIDTAEAQVTKYQEAVNNARSELAAAYARESSVLQSTIKRMDDFVKSLAKFRNELRFERLTPVERLSDAKESFDRIAARAATGDEEALSNIEDSAKRYVELAKAQATTAEEFAYTISRVDSKLATAQLTALRQKTIAEQQLSALQKQVEGLITVNGSVLSVKDAINNLIAKQSELAAAMMALANAAAAAKAPAPVAAPVQQSNTNPLMAELGTVGTVLGGVAPIIGKALNQLGALEGMGAGTSKPSKGFWGTRSDHLASYDVGTPYVPYDQTAKIHKSEIIMDPRSSEILRRYGINIQSRGQDNSELVAEMRALREEVASLRAAGEATARNTFEQKKQLQRWDGDGMPEVRTT